MTRVTRLGLWIAIVLWLLLGGAGWLVVCRGSGPITDDRYLMAGWMALVAGLIAMRWLLITTPPDAIKLTRQMSERLILAGALFLQILTLIMIAPVLSDDVVRYRLDALHTLEGRSPYVLTPAQSKAQGWGDELDNLTPHPQVHAIYPPVAQGFFAIARWTSNSVVTHTPTSLSSLGQSDWWEHVFFFRLIQSIAAMAATWGLLVLLKQQERSSWWAMLWAWHPLVLMESAGQAHIDFTGVALLVWSLAMCGKQRWVLGGVFAALAVGIKPQVALVLPVVLARAPWKAWGGAAITLGLTFAPLLYQGGLAYWLGSLARFSASWEANGSIYELIKWTGHWFDPSGVGLEKGKALSRGLSLLLTLLAAGWAWRACRWGKWTPASGVMVVMMVLFLSAPVLYPWYLSWPLAMAVVAIRPAMNLIKDYQMPGSAAMLLWSGTVALSYMLGHSKDWTLPASISWLQYGPVYVTLLLECLLRRDSYSPGKKTEHEQLG